MPSSPYTIRPASDADLPAVAAMSAQWEREDSTIGLRADTAEVLKPRLGEFFLVAEVDGQAVGFAVAVRQQSKPGQLAVAPDASECLEIDDLYVAPAWRGRGIGSALVKQLLDRGAATGLPLTILYSSNRDWLRTVRFYERLGFAMWHIRMWRDGQTPRSTG